MSTKHKTDDAHVCMYCGASKASARALAAHARFCASNPAAVEARRFLLEEVCAQGSAAAVAKIKARAAADPRNVIKLRRFTCRRCGKQYTLMLTDRQVASGEYRKHCSRACANSRRHTEETKQKISASARRGITGGRIKARIHGGMCLSHATLINGVALVTGRKSVESSKCVLCGRAVTTKYVNAYCRDCADKHGLKRLAYYDNETGKRIVFSETREALRTSARARVAAGINVGWTSRNITSYPERFWKEVLHNNGIDYVFNAPVAKSQLGLDEKSFYFLDFLIAGYIDLEIDGKQHTYEDRRASDEKRDMALRSRGYVVYRVPWNEVITQDGKELMRKKVADFLAFVAAVKDENPPALPATSRYSYECHVCGRVVNTNVKCRTKFFYYSRACGAAARHLPRTRRTR